MAGEMFLDPNAGQQASGFGQNALLPGQNFLASNPTLPQPLTGVEGFVNRFGSNNPMNALMAYGGTLGSALGQAANSPFATLFGQATAAIGQGNLAATNAQKQESETAAKNEALIRAISGDSEGALKALAASSQTINDNPMLKQATQMSLAPAQTAQQPSALGTPIAAATPTQTGLTPELAAQFPQLSKAMSMLDTYFGS